MTPLQLADLEGEGTSLRSRRFDDIYFQPDVGLAETEHVFLEGNRLKERFNAMPNGGQFVVGELGFGTGLNILAVADLFQRHGPTEGGLHCWSVEGFPIPQGKMRQILKMVAEHFPILSPLATRLSTLYPTPRPGIWSCQLTPKIRLTINFTDVGTALSDVSFSADAWFLDGFSPAKNPDMWSPSIMEAVVAHTKPGGTLASFTVAGAVRRALANTGMTVKKAQGFGKKRDMLTASKPGPTCSPQPPIRRIAILGAGIAGTSLAWQASQMGLCPTLIDPNGPASGASGNPVGLIMPRIEASLSPSAHLYRDAFLFALQFYQDATPEALVPCGGTLLAGPDQSERHRKVVASGLWAESDLHLADNCDLTIPAGATLKVADAVRTLAHDIHCIRDDIKKMQYTDNGIEISSDHEAHLFDAAVICAGPNSAKYAALNLDLRASRGQMDLFAGPVPSAITTQGTYIAAHNGHLAAGATYDDVPLDHQAIANTDSTQRNREAAANLMGRDIGIPIAARASVRAVTKDRHPIAGQVVDNLGTPIVPGRLFVLTGLGSRGLSTGPLLAAHVLSSICGGVSPIGLASVKFVAPERFATRRARAH
ncbi:MAG: tRNA (5-methylaminomethyl-2-thiouridine)(34)-methyltransferase MnmD, partial [Pseudomonadota bacterium]